mgnify:CR=1 FL=1
MSNKDLYFKRDDIYEISLEYKKISKNFQALLENKTFSQHLNIFFEINKQISEQNKRWEDMYSRVNISDSFNDLEMEEGQ